MVIAFSRVNRMNRRRHLQRLLLPRNQQNQGRGTPLQQQIDTNTSTNTHDDTTQTKDEEQLCSSGSTPTPASTQDNNSTSNQGRGAVLHVLLCNNTTTPDAVDKYEYSGFYQLHLYRAPMTRSSATAADRTWSGECQNTPRRQQHQ